MVFLTKIDAYDPDLVGKDLTKTFHSKKLLELCKVIKAVRGQQASGFSQNCVCICIYQLVVVFSAYSSTLPNLQKQFV